MLFWQTSRWLGGAGGGLNFNISKTGHLGLCNIITTVPGKEGDHLISALPCELAPDFDPSIGTTPSSLRMPENSAPIGARILVVAATVRLGWLPSSPSQRKLSQLFRAYGKTSGEVHAASIAETLAACDKFSNVVHQKFDNIAFFAKTCEGGLFPCRREIVSNTYHVDGDQVVHQTEALESAFEDCLPAHRACEDTKIILLSRYTYDGWLL